MAASYQLLPASPLGLATVLRTADGAVIPLAPGNQDFAAYQAWLAAGNTPDPTPIAPQPITITAAAFLARFTQAEQTAVQQLAITNGQIALGLTLGLAQGWITLNSPILTNWMAALVSAGAITADRSTGILTP